MGGPPVTHNAITVSVHTSHTSDIFVLCFESLKRSSASPCLWTGLDPRLFLFGDIYIFIFGGFSKRITAGENSLLRS